MPSTAATLPRRTVVASLRARHALVAHDVRRCEDTVARLRSQLGQPLLAPGGVPPAEREMISAVRDLVEARARLAQVSRELRLEEGR